MMLRKKNICTTNKEIYKKFNELNFTSHIVLEGIKPSKLNRLIKNINKTNKVLSVDVKDKYIVVKKLKPINYNMYLRNMLK